MSDVDGLRQRLLARLTELEREVARADALRREPLDPDLGEQARIIAASEVVDNVEAASFIEIKEIKGALARIETGTYGFCRACGGDIAPARLEALPSTSTCFTCASARAHRPT